MAEGIFSWRPPLPPSCGVVARRWRRAGGGSRNPVRAFAHLARLLPRDCIVHEQYLQVALRLPQRLPLHKLAVRSLAVESARALARVAVRDNVVLAHADACPRMALVPRTLKAAAWTRGNAPLGAHTVNVGVGSAVRAVFADAAVLRCYDDDLATARRLRCVRTFTVNSGRDWAVCLPRTCATARVLVYWAPSTALLCFATRACGATRVEFRVWTMPGWQKVHLRRRCAAHVLMGE